MTRHLTLLLVTVVGLAACVSEEEPPVVPTDATVVVTPPDASASDEPVIGLVQRSFECKLICSYQKARCGDAGGSDCYDECVRFSTGTFYCPEQ